MLHLPEDESVVLSGPVARRLVESGDGDAALLYIAVLRNRGSIDDERLRLQLGWPAERFRRGLDALAGQGLIARPDCPAGQPAPQPPAPAQPAAEQRPEYTRADLARALEGGEFAALANAVEGKLGKKLTTRDLAVLLGLYDEQGLPADVIFLLVGFCSEQISAQFGEGRRPTLRQIEKEGFAWARLGLMNQERAAAHIKKVSQRREALPRLMRLLRLGERAPSPGEEKYLAAWNDMGFDDEALLRAYDKTVLKCGELRWQYMNSILSSWHKKGLHTLAEVEERDRPTGSAKPRRRAAPPSPEGRREAGGAVQEDLARLERFRQQLRREKEET